MFQGEWLPVYSCRDFRVEVLNEPGPQPSPTFKVTHAFSSVCDCDAISDLSDIDVVVDCFRDFREVIPFVTPVTPEPGIWIEKVIYQYYYQAHRTPIEMNMVSKLVEDDDGNKFVGILTVESLPGMKKLQRSVTGKFELNQFVFDSAAKSNGLQKELVTVIKIGHGNAYTKHYKR